MQHFNLISNKKYRTEQDRNNALISSLPLPAEQQSLLLNNHDVVRLYILQIKKTNFRI